MNALSRSWLMWLLLVISLSGCVTSDGGTPSKPTQAASGVESQSNEKVALARETEHFLLYCARKDIVRLQEFSEALEDGFSRVTRDLNCTVGAKIAVRIYPDTETFHKAIGKPWAPWWYVGEGSGGMISIASNMSHASPVNVLVHELTHVIVGSNFGWLPEWLFQGIASYEGRETPISSVESVVRSSVRSQRIPTLRDLDTGYWSFANSGGYEYSFVAVDFTIKEFGFDALRDFLMSPNDYEGSFGLNESELNERWIQWLKNNYK